jgi:uncharacterized protein
VAVVLRACERRAVPWKNGGGVTREVAVHPAGSDFEAFDWRVSIAEVRKPGPFSAFPGIERHIAILSGRLELAIGGSRLVLSGESAPLTFAGETAVHAQPLDGAVTDLNVMAQRARCQARLTRESLEGTVRLEAAGATSLVLAVTGMMLMHASGTTALEPLDAVLLAADACCELRGQGRQPSCYYRAAMTPAA